MNSYEYLLSDINNIKGIGTKTSKLFKKKNINTIFDLLWSLPRASVDRTNLVKIRELMSSHKDLKRKIESMEKECRPS